jgi:hypothetical protein
MSSSEEITMNLLKLNISYEPKTPDGGLIVSNYGEILSEIYIDECKSYNQNEPFYLKIGNTTIISIDNKIKLENGINIRETYPLIYNIKFNSTVIAVYYTKRPVITAEFISYN